MSGRGNCKHFEHPAYSADLAPSDH